MWQDDETPQQNNGPEMVTIDLHGKKWVQPKLDGELEKMIFRAVIGRRVDILKDLHESGATFNIIDKDKNTPLHLFAPFPLFFHLFQLTRNYSLVCLLLLVWLSCLFGCLVFFKRSGRVKWG